MTHVLRIQPAVPETIRFKIKQLIEDLGYTAHSGFTQPDNEEIGISYNEMVFAKAEKK